MDSTVAVSDLARLDALERTNLLDSPGEEQFDRLTRLAAANLRTPVALLTLVDKNRLFFKSFVGLSDPWRMQRQASLNYSFCPDVVATGQPLAISDSRTYVRDLNSPVLTEFGAFAYAGVPLVTSRGFVIGSFCAIEHRPRQWSLTDLNVLKDLATLVMTEIELRAYVREIQQQTAAAEHERQLKTTLLESTSEGICGFDLEGRCTFINRSGAELLGYKPNDLRGKRMQILMHYVDRDGQPIKEEDWPIYKALERGRECLVEDAVFSRKDRSTFLVEYSFSPIVEEGSVRGAVIAFVDVTERKRADEALRQAEEKYRLIFENSAEGIFQSTPDGQFISINPALARIFGYSSPEEMTHGIGNIAQDLYIDPDRRLQFERGMETNNTVSEFEAQARRKDGSIIWTSESGRAIRDADGIIRYFEGTVENITERREAQEALRRQNEYLAALHETTLAMMNRLELSDLLETIVLRAAQLLGTSHGYICLLEPGDTRAAIKVGVGLYSEHIGYPIEKGGGVPGKVWASGRTHVINDYAAWPGRTPDFDHASVRAVLATPLVSGKEFLGVIGMAYDGGTNRQFGREEVGLVGRFAQLASVALDNARLYTAAQQELGERRRVEAALYEAKEAAEVANHAKSLFLANMSHELRTPLNAVIGYSELLQEEATDQELDAFIPDLQNIHAAGRHLLDLINNVLDLSKIEAGKMDLLIETLDIMGLIGDVTSTIQPLVQKNGNTLGVQCPSDIGTMRADGVKIRQSLLNLLSNACKFTEKGVVTLSVARERLPDRSWEGDWITFSVADSGIGMTPAQMTRLFEAFAQAEASIARRFGGTGLGLALTRRFSKLMGGDVSVTSELGHGSTFSIKLPADVTPIDGATSSSDVVYQQSHSQAVA